MLCILPCPLCSTVAHLVYVCTIGNSLDKHVELTLRRGLNTINLSGVNTAQQTILFCLIMLGSAIFVSGVVVHVRKDAIEHRCADVVELRRRRQPSYALSIRNGFSRTRSRSNDGADTYQSNNLEDDGAAYSKASTNNRTDMTPTEQPKTSHEMLDEASGRLVPDEKHVSTDDEQSDEQADIQHAQGPGSSAAAPTRHIHTLTDLAVRHDSNTTSRARSPNAGSSPGAHITFDPSVRRPRSRSSHFLPTNGVGAHSNASVRRRSIHPSAVTSDAQSEVTIQSASNRLPFASSGYVSRNSQFSQLSEKERKELGGYEYKAIKFLSWLVPIYFVLFQLLGCLGLGAYVAYNRSSAALENGLNPWWVGSFNAVSAFNNSGMSLLDANMVAFQTSIYMLITMSLLILAGNTCYPVFLRLIVWTFSKLMPKSEEWEDYRRTLQFLLDHPRRCYTNMFPSQHTWWLFFAVIVLNSTDWVAFELLNLGNHAIESLPTGIRILDGLFQAFAVRSGGFYVVPISNVRIGLQVLYVIMMYISVYPVVITMRNTNVYEERSLGIYADDPDYVAERSASKSGVFARFLTTTRVDETTQYFVRHQLRAQLSHDLWSVVLAIFLIMCFEATRFESNPTVFSVFNVIFETVSAYGCVGISVGLPDQAYSFSGALTTASKLVLCAVMIRGRHRGLPVALDKAILLPREELGEVEEDDAMIRLERTISRGRMA